VNEEETIRLIHEYCLALLDRMFDELSRKAPDGSSEHVSNKIVAVAIRIQAAWRKTMKSPVPPVVYSCLGFNDH
jgi:hypothetical protein